MTELIDKVKKQLLSQSVYFEGDDQSIEMNSLNIAIFLLKISKEIKIDPTKMEYTKADFISVETIVRLLDQGNLNE